MHLTIPAPLETKTLLTHTKETVASDLFDYQSLPTPSISIGNVSAAAWLRTTMGKNIWFGYITRWKKA
jgi:hypothetical protein